MVTDSLISATRRRQSSSIAPDSVSITRLIEWCLEGTWLAMIVLIPNVVLPEESFLSITSMPKVVLLRVAASVFVVLIATKFVLFLLSGTGVIRRPTNVNPVKVSNRGTLLVWASVLVLVVTLASMLSSISVASSLWGKDPSGDGAGLYTLVAYLTLFATLVFFVTGPARVERVWLAVSLSGLTAAFIGVAQYFGLSPFGVSGTSGVRPTGPSGNPVFFGSLLVITAPVALAYLSHVALRSRFSISLFWLLAFTGAFFFALAIVATASRGAWLGLITTLVVFSVLGWRGFRIRRQMWVFVGASFGAAAALTIFFSPAIGLSPVLDFGRNLLTEGAVRDSSTAGDGLLAVGVGGSSQAGKVDESAAILSIVKGRVLNTNGIDNVYSRLNNWSVSLDLSMTRPQLPGSNEMPSLIRHALGYGPDSFRYVFPLRASLYQLRWRTDAAHNDWLTRFVEQGLLGLIAWGTLWIAAAAVAFNLAVTRAGASPQVRLLGAGVAAALAGRFVEQLTGIPNIGDTLIFWTLLGLLAAVAIRLHRSSTFARGVRGGRISPAGHGIRAGLVVASIIVASLAVVVAWERNIEYWKADRAAAVVAYGGANGPDPAIAMLTGAISLAPDVPEYRHLLSIVRQGQASKASDANEAYAYLKAAYDLELAVLDRYPFGRDAYFRAAFVTWKMAQISVPGMAEETINLYEHLALLAPNHSLTLERVAILRDQLADP